jgi:HlyD family secretion protein
MRGGFAVRIVAVGVVAIGAVSFLPLRQTIDVPLILVTRSPPRSVVTVEPGVLASITVAEGATVHAGDVLARVGKSEEFAEVDRLAAYCGTALVDLERNREPGPPPALALGGTLQTVHASTAGALTDLHLKLAFSDYRPRLAAAAEELSSSERRQVTLRNEISLAHSLVSIAERQLRIKSEVAAKGWISEAVLAETRAELLRQRMLAVEKSQELEHVRAEGEQVAESATGLRLAQAEERARIYQDARQAVMRLAGEIEAWRGRRILVAPVAGRVRYTAEWALGQPLQQGTELAVVTPLGAGAMAVGTVPPRVKAAVVGGAEVKLTIPSYPSFRFGWVIGRVEGVSNVATKDGYQLRVGLPNGLVTTYGQRIPFRQRTAVSGAIRVRQGRLVDFVLGSIRSHLDQSQG